MDIGLIVPAVFLGISFIFLFLIYTRSITNYKISGIAITFSLIVISFSLLIEGYIGGVVFTLLFISSCATGIFLYYQNTMGLNGLDQQSFMNSRLASSNEERVQNAINIICTINEKQPELIRQIVLKPEEIQ